MQRTKSEKTALREIGLSAAKDAGKEALRGAAVYAAVNLAQVSKSVAAATITGLFRVADQIELLRAGETSSVECAEAVADVFNSVLIGTVFAELAKKWIPHPVLGPIVGNTAGVFLYQIVNAYTRIAMEALPGYRTEAAAG
jgi:phosphotransferase system  glucose/maltose/N-acetylglucosamine-specific IIC component